MKVDILGTEYKIKEKPSGKFGSSPNADGNIKFGKKIITIANDDCNPKEYKQHILRHEIVHGYIFESGCHQQWHNDDLVDWLAVMIPKMMESFKEAGAI